MRGDSCCKRGCELNGNTQRFGAAEFCTARASACAFIVKVCAKVSDANRASLRQIFKKLVKDETPMVRCSALRWLPAFCESLPSNIIIGEIAKDILMHSVNDDEDSVKLLVPATLSVICGKLSDSERTGLIIALLKMIIKDGSWRVRSALANELPTIAKPFVIDVVMSDMYPILFKLMRDPEAETKTAACKAISGILGLLGGQQQFIAERFIPEFEGLATDGAL